ncbi:MULTISPECIES: fluoride efflux transporter CrcB [unclassified Halomonas]|uniref:fluoride efflux transporter CrcB n=1 Tax=unclassified Halomonas TaxID=2609666 RepID=UPI001268EB46|nr:fluoride efflux transporter CrcB [Halomonas sp. THAF12]QFT86578.1 Putative fluoride ion transporter CrcB [Halomonas sp. THAF12]
MSGGIVGLGLVAVGGALGGMARLAVGDLAARWLGRGFPWGTLAVNVLGCLAIGALAPALGWPVTASPAWSLLAVGGLGGFTTVSSFSLQTLTLWQEGRPGPAVANVLITLVAGVAAVALGWWLAGGGA